MLESLLSLHSKYSGNLPRYTSYPTAVELRQVGDIAKTTSDYGCSLDGRDSASLYVHIPYCPSLCYFCACNKIITTQEQERDGYLKFLAAEIELIAKNLPGSCRFVQVHLGGGSPSYLSVAQLNELNSIISQLNLSVDAQKSIEVDPRTFSEEKLGVMYEAGYRRFSLGVQDFDPKVQELVNRVQPLELTEHFIDAIRAFPETTLNLDLIYGLPGQTDASFRATIAQVLRLRPNRLALYGYAHVGWKAKAQNTLTKYGLPDSADRIRSLAYAVSELEGAGYVYIGMDHFALPDDELNLALREKRLRRNFMGYTTVTGEALIAAGVSGISDTGRFMFQNSLEVKEYSDLISKGSLPIIKYVERSDEDQIRGFIIESLMCHRSITKAEIHNRFSQTELIDSIFNSGFTRLLPFTADSLVVLSQDRIEITQLGCFFMRHIVSAFDQYLERSGNREKRFSAAV